MDDRRAKLERLREQGIDPFPHEFDGVVAISDVHSAHEGLEAGEETDSPTASPGGSADAAATEARPSST